MRIEDYQKQLIDLIEKAIEDFNSGMPGIERQVYGRLLLLIKDLEIKNGKVLNTLSNLKKIGQIKSEIQSAVISKKYADAIQKFVDSFNSISALQLKYFKTIDDKRLPHEKLDEIQKQAKQAIIDKLSGAGLDGGVVLEIENILRTNITTGGSFEDFEKQLRAYALSTPQSSGKLASYVSQVTTDSLNQFSAQYTQIISTDLGLKWHMYIGSNKATTREFCEFLTKKKYVHESEIPEILKGDIDGHQCRINPKTDLWYGAIEQTNQSNFQINRGGYTCGHQFIPVADAVVPSDLRSKFK